MFTLRVRNANKIKRKKNSKNFTAGVGEKTESAQIVYRLHAKKGNLHAKCMLNSIIVELIIVGNGIETATE